MKVEVNFEYKGAVIPVMLDESLAHLNNMLDMLCFTKILEKKKNNKKWDKAYDFLEAKCEEAFRELGYEEAMINGFVLPISKEEDPTGLRVQMYEDLYKK
jgi:hypothetical protein